MSVHDVNCDITARQRKLKLDIRKKLRVLLKDGQNMLKKAKFTYSQKKKKKQQTNKKKQKKQTNKQNKTKRKLWFTVHMDHAHVKDIG